MKLELRNDIFFAEVERLISEGQSVTIPVKGFSMRPMMRSGKDKVILTAHSDKAIGQGAVMLFRHNGHHIMHRIVKIEGQNITFAGDGNYNKTERATKDDIVATVTAIMRWRIYSTLWLALPRIVRRYILGLTNRLKLWI